MIDAGSTPCTAGRNEYCPVFLIIDSVFWEKGRRQLGARLSCVASITVCVIEVVNSDILACDLDSTAVNNSLLTIPRKVI